MPQQAVQPDLWESVSERNRTSFKFSFYLSYIYAAGREVFMILAVIFFLGKVKKKTPWIQRLGIKILGMVRIPSCAYSVYEDEEGQRRKKTAA